jgi:hypothetical protein
VPELSLGEAVDPTRTGDGWVSRGGSVADRAIRTLTDAPVDHVGMACDPGSSWSGDDLQLRQGARLGPEIPVDVPAAQPSRRTR